MTSSQPACQAPGWGWRPAYSVEGTYKPTTAGTSSVNTSPRSHSMAPTISLSRAGRLGGSYLTRDSFRDFRNLHLLGDAQNTEKPNLDPADIELVPGKAVASRGRMRVVVIVPAFAKREQRHPPAVAGTVARREAALAPHMCGGVHEPGGVEPKSDAEEHHP